MTGIEGKVAVVTGVSSGVGRGIAAEFARMGAKVVGMARRAELGATLERDERDARGEFAFVAGDVRRTEDCEKAVQRAVDAYGGLDVLVNNAGIEGEVKDFHQLTDDEWLEVIETNLNGVFRCTRAAIPRMLERGGGVVINVASINAAPGMAVAHMAAYNASKAAVVQLTNTLAVEYVLRNIRCNAVYLGGVEGDTAYRTQTKMAKVVLGPDFERAEGRSEQEEFMIQQPDDVARAIALLCSDDARLVTGSTIAIDRAATAGFVASSMVHLSCAQLLPG